MNAWTLREGVIIGVGLENIALIDIASEARKWLPASALETIDRWLEDGIDEDARAALFKDDAEQWLVPFNAPHQPDAFVEGQLSLLESGFAYRVPTDAQALLNASRRDHARRRRFLSHLGQCPTLPETTLRRALSVAEGLGKRDGKVVCIGDDDLVGLTLARLGFEVTVLELDDYLVGLIEHVAKEEGLSVTVECFDLCEPLDEAWRGRFDAFVTDPMSNEACLGLFISRGRAMCKPNALGATAINAQAFPVLRKVLAEMGAEDWIRFERHNVYYSQFMRMHTYQSDWVVLRCDAATKPTLSPDVDGSALGLYEEEFLHRKLAWLLKIEDIDTAAEILPLHLREWMSVLIDAARVQVIGYIEDAKDEVSSLSALTRSGWIRLSIDRAHRRLLLEASPLQGDVGKVAEKVIVRMLKPQGRVESNRHRDVWTMRVR